MAKHPQNDAAVATKLIPASRCEAESGWPNYMPRSLEGASWSSVEEYSYLSRRSLDGGDAIERSWRRLRSDAMLQALEMRCC